MSTTPLTLSPEDDVVVAEVFRRLSEIVGSMGQRADGNLNHGDLFRALDAEFVNLNAALDKP